MKTYIKRIVIGLLTIVLFSSMALYAYARNSHQDHFAKSVMVMTYVSHVDKARNKFNTSEMFIQITDSHAGSSFYIKAMGCDDENRSKNLGNHTVYNNQLVDHVRISPYDCYSVDNWIYQRTDGYAFFYITSLSGTGTIIGYWAPDSYEVYNSPIL